MLSILNHCFGDSALLSAAGGPVGFVSDMSKGLENAVDSVFSISHSHLFHVLCIEHRKVRESFLSHCTAWPSLSPITPGNTTCMYCSCSQRNILDRFKDMPSKEEAAAVYIRAAEAYTKQACTEYLSYLHGRFPEVYEYVMKVPVERWARSYLPFPSLGVVRSNIAGKHGKRRCQHMRAIASR